MSPRVMHAGTGGGGGTDTALGLTTTSNMLTTMQSRASSGPFKTDGDHATNSPGEWDDVVSRKTTFMSDPSAKRWGGPSGTGCIPYGSTSDDPSWIDEFGYISSAALFSLVEDDATVRSAVATELLAQAGVSRLDFSDESQWCDENGTDINPSFETATFVAAMVAVMDWVEIGDSGAFTSGEKDTLHDWFFYFGQWAMRELTTAYAKRVDVGDATTAPPWANPAADTSFDLAYDALGEDTVGNIARFFNNRRNCMIRACGMIGKKLTLAGHTDPGAGYGWTSAELLTAAKNLTKGWLVYSAFPEGYNGEFERIDSSGGMFYPWQTVGPLLTLAHCLAVNGDTDLLTYSTEEGHEFSVSTGTPKSLEWMTLELLKYTEQNEYDREKDAVTIGMSSQTSGTEYGHDATAAILYPHATNQSSVKSGFERTRSGMSGWLASMNGYGSRPWYISEWGPFPVLNLMFNGVSVGESAYWLEDTFTEASDTALESHTPDTPPLGAWGSGTSSNTKFSVDSASNTLRQDGDATTDNIARYPTTVGHADAEATLVVNFAGHTTINDRFSVWLRDTDGTWEADSDATVTGYQLRLDAEGQVLLYEWSSGTETLLDATSPSIDNSADLTLRLRVEGSSIKGYLNGVEQVSATDSTHTAAGNVVIQMYDLPTGAYFDSLKVELL